MITIRPSATADTRSCDYANVTRDTLLASSEQHIADVRKALGFFVQELDRAAERHDTDKLTDIDSFHADFVTGFAQTGWWDRHRKLNRHHLLQADGVPEDVNLIDVLDMIADCVMAGMARTGTVYPLEIPDDVLRRALDNTAALLKAQVQVDVGRRTTYLGSWKRKRQRKRWRLVQWNTVRVYVLPRGQRLLISADGANDAVSKAQLERDYRPLGLL